MTTPTARSTTLPRRMNCLKPLSMGGTSKRKGVNLRRQRGVGQVEACVGRAPSPAALEGDFGRELQLPKAGKQSPTSKVKRGGRGRPPHMAWRSDPHGHDDVAVLVIFTVGGTELSGGLRVFELEFYIAGTDCLQEIQNVLGVEADRERVALVAGFERVFRFTGFGRGGRQFHFALFEAQADSPRTLVGELGDAGDGRA